ncbi:C-X-C chemokine receptor type 3-like isoform X2 [Megalobrama amblycephala]|uniref:C-X-C chemokine receptor type 3-like isoform X2 n=1 Tax=Megalobrama amblycephala TaxID=75352 RepID=UPI002013FBAE|nr:C-X-C chemokine receptor type 3-like isoform X2 [Megalobrama amblycephala]
MDVDKKVTFMMEDFYFPADYNENYSESYEDGCCGEGLVCDQESSMHFDSIFIPILYSLALVVGLVGNGLVLVVMWKKRINFYCGIFMLSCISLDRYLSIVHAVQMYSRKKPMVIHCCCLMVWLFCLLLSIPDWIFLEAFEDSNRQDKIECVPLFPSESWHLYSRLLYHILGFALPALMMLFCYSCILLRVRRGSQGMQKKRAIRVIVALVLAFFISWTPYNITLIFDTIHNKQTINSTTTSTFCDSNIVLDLALTVTSTLGYFHCCVNPVLYAFVGVKFRKHLLDMLRPLGFTLKGPAGMKQQDHQFQ